MYIAETDSTNRLLRKQYLDREDLFTIIADYQTSGRGQQGNRWEAEKGKNLLFSTLIRDWHIPVSDQFVITQIVSLAIYKATLFVLPEKEQPQLAIKWPNDLYYGNFKLSGTLIENIWQSGEVSCSIAGVGLNVNQTKFLSDAPNPISLCQITHCEIERNLILQRFLLSLQSYRSLLFNANAKNDFPNFRQQVAHEYMKCLYRREGLFLWEEREVSAEPSTPQLLHNSRQFLARIQTVLPSGELQLLTEDNRQLTFHFKQVRYVL